MGKERTKREQGGLNRITRLFQQFDYYGESSQLKIKGADTYPSCLGTLISLVIIITVIAYAIDKYDVCSTYGNTTYNEYQTEMVNSHIKHYDNVYNYETTSLHMAFMVTNKTTGEVIPMSTVNDYI